MYRIKSLYDNKFEVYEATLVELSKTLAPSLKLYEFNYLVNKAINLYTNKIYNIYDINLQTTDDLRVLKATAYLEPKLSEDATNAVHGKSIYNNSEVKSYLSSKYQNIKSINGATYTVEFPKDYLHLLNCVCVYYVAKLKDCYDAGTYIQIPATRLTADSWGSIINDIYNRPSPMKPYYYIHNQTAVTSSSPGEAPYLGDAAVEGYDFEDTYRVTSTTGESGDKSNLPRTFKLKKDQFDTSKINLIEKPIGTRASNVSKVTCEIRYGKDNSVFQLVEVLIDYIKSPQYVRLTQELLDLTEDTSQMMEFPDYVNLEIVNELVHLIMEKVSDPRLQTNLQISQSIARPTQQLQTTASQEA